MKMQCRLCGQILTDEAPPPEIVTRVAELGEAHDLASRDAPLPYPKATVIEEVVKQHMLTHARDQVTQVSP